MTGNPGHGREISFPKEGKNGKRTKDMRYIIGGKSKMAGLTPTKQ